ncbi:RNA polymerase sigma factor [Anaeromyxobacter oryzisoli]|uniref:RNA polymerase sigma factor n=1 Tax=Anaeromyxobacter oryzisoli TaxID=2925408 RepID=UPI001F5756E0|nr:sigma-70 family RNA polymerase sigma factor [Anaeromyxobacter sp. SG63]
MTGSATGARSAGTDPIPAAPTHSPRPRATPIDAHGASPLPAPEAQPRAPGEARPRSAFLGWVSDLARGHSAALAHAARREGLGPEDALDAAQEAFCTFLALPRARALTAHDGEARGLLLAMVRNVARNMRRRHHRAVHHDGLDEASELPDDGPSADELVARAEEHARFGGCVRRLAALRRKVVTLRMIDQLSGLETARALGLEPGRVAVLLHRARKDLLACLTA